jgi:hypothetical protein
MRAATSAGDSRRHSPFSAGGTRLAKALGALKLADFPAGLRRNGCDHGCGDA